MAAVTQTIKNYLGGVSNQPDDQKLAGQVREALNAYPDPTFGLQKRPGFKFRTELKTVGGTAFHTAQLDNGKWFYYNRDADEKYIGCIVGAAAADDAGVYLWNTVDNTACTVNYTATTYTITDSGTAPSGNNGTYTGVNVTGGSGSGMKVTATVQGGEVTILTVHTEGSGYKVGDTITIAKADVGNTFTNPQATIASISSKSYLDSALANDYDFLTIRDTTLITNKTRVVSERAASSFTSNKEGTVRIHLVEYGAKYSITIASTESSPAFTTFTSTVNTRSGDEFTNAADTSSNTSGAEGKLDAAEILAALRTLILAGGDGSPGAVSGFGADQVKIIGTSLEIDFTGTGGFTLQSEGGVGGEALTSYQDTVDIVSELPSQTEHGRVVKIQNTSAATDTYYAKFVANDGVSGPGVWEETIGPGVSTGLNLSTMPHHLYNTAKNVFTFSEINGLNANGTTATVDTLAANKWVDRLVGDASTNESPAFVGSTIQQAFYYNNRLGFLSDDNVEMSRAGKFFNFYMTTAQTATDADPIGISCSSTRPATLHGIIPTASGLLLFSQNQQFVLFSSEGNLTPSTALIRGLSNYRMDANIDPVDVGTHINFVSKTHDTAGFTRVFGLLPQQTGTAPKVVDVGRVVAEYIPATITALTASPQNSFIAMYGTDTDKIYFYRTYSDGERDIMQSWFNWQCPGNTHFVEVDSDTMYSVVKTGTGSDARYNLVSATMTQTPEETIIVTADGQQMNPHMDFYTAADNGLVGGSNKKVVYDAAGDFSKCYIPFKDVTSLTPVIVIAGNATSNFSGTTESGFTITPTRASDGDGTYFKVPGKDLSAQAANVYVGYKYNYDITLPKLYFRVPNDPKQTDYTANLTIARMKFSIGKSSVVGFKLKRKGVQASTQSFVGDGSTVAFSPSFDVLDKADVIVKRNGAEQTLVTTFTGTSEEKKSQYTIADHASLEGKVTVTFGTAPDDATSVGNESIPADSIEIYVDQWYTLQPTQEANYYLGDDVPIETQNLFIVPIHQKTDNYTLRIFSDSPFPLALTSASWEGNYSPRYYRRT